MVRDRNLEPTASPGTALIGLQFLKQHFGGGQCDRLRIRVGHGSGCLVLSRCTLFLAVFKLRAQDAFLLSPAGQQGREVAHGLLLRQKVESKCLDLGQQVGGAGVFAVNDLLHRTGVLTGIFQTGTFNQRVGKGVLRRIFVRLQRFNPPAQRVEPCLRVAQKPFGGDP